VCSHVEGPKIGELGPAALGWTRILTPRNVPLPIYYRPKFGRSRSNRMGVSITKMRREKLTPRVPPFKVIRGHRNRHGSIGYHLILVHLPISYRFLDIWRFHSRIANFSIPSFYLKSRY